MRGPGEAVIGSARDDLAGRGALAAELVTRGHRELVAGGGLQVRPQVQGVGQGVQELGDLSPVILGHAVEMNKVFELIRRIIPTN